MYIKQIENLADAGYAQFAARLGSIFNSPEWLMIFDTQVVLYGIFTAEHELTGSFFLMREKKAGFSFFKSPSYTPHNGCFFEHKAQNISKALSQDKKIIELIADFFDKLPAGVISVSFPPAIVDMQPFFWKKFKVIPHYTYHLPLSETADQLGKRMSADHRNLLKKGAKDGLVVKRITDFSLVKAMVLKTFDRKNKSIDHISLDKILAFANESNSYAFAAFENDKPIAANLTIFDKHAAYYLLSGYDPAVKHPGAGIMCLWESILLSKEKGLVTFDFEGSMLQEVERFFRGFGPQLIPYYSVNKALLPLEFILKLVKREQF